MSKVLETYFVDTHEYNHTTGLLNQMEYFKYESGVYDGLSDSKIVGQIHQDILSLALL
jgi:hypothetical protein